MNSIIKELIQKAKEPESEGLGGYRYELNPEKLVQLVVQECGDVVQSYMTRWPEDCELTKQIKKHFGIIS